MLMPTIWFKKKKQGSEKDKNRYCVLMSEKWSTSKDGEARGNHTKLGKMVQGSKKKMVYENMIMIYCIYAYATPFTQTRIHNFFGFELESVDSVGIQLPKETRISKKRKSDTSS